MKKRIEKLTKILLIAVVAMQLVLSQQVYASGNIKIYDTQDSMNSTVINDGKSIMLKQDWFGMRFELDSSGIYRDRKVVAVDSDEYEKALQEVNFDISKIGAYNVYFLDYKLKDYGTAMALSFTDNSVVVFGTHKKLSKRTVHRLAVHELGHQVDFRLMDEQKWAEYKKIRGIEDASKYNDFAEDHSNRPQEIFAEDFRLVMGGEAAKDFMHENVDLQDPTTNPELVGFFKNLVK